MGRFKQKNDIFVNEDVLTDQYTPEQILERDREMRDYEEALQPIANGDSPDSIFVYGETGTGKTVATERILCELQEDAQDFEGVSIKVVWLNCKDKTSYQAAVHLVNKFRSKKDKLSQSGHPRGYVHESLWEHLEEVDESYVIFVLDEIDSFGTDDELLYQLPRANSHGHVMGTKVGTIGISNNFKYRNSLSGRVQDSLCEEEIHFKPYDATQLKAILTPRAEKAFADDVVTESEIALAAGLAGQDSGSARHALDILRKAGKLARKNDDKEVTEAHVREAKGEVERGVVEAELRALPTQSHLIIHALAILAEKDETPASRLRIQDVYEELAQQIDTEPKAPRTVHNRLNQLQLKGFVAVSEENQGAGNGRSGRRYLYELDVKHNLVKDVLMDEDRLQPAMGQTGLGQFG